MLALAPPALAAGPHVFAFSFSGGGSTPLEHPVGIAVDNSAGPSKGDVYVADSQARRVDKFDSTGKLLFTASTPGYPRFVAVDSSNGPSAGDVYVAEEFEESESSQVRKLDPNGNPVSSWGGLTFSHVSGGIAVGPDGKLFVQSGWWTETATIFVYDQGGSPVSNFPLEGWTRGNGIAVDASGDVYVDSRDGIDKYDSSGTDLGVVDESAEAEAIAIDPSADRVYVKHRAGFIDEFSAGCPPGECVPEASFGNGYLESGFELLGVAVDAATGTVFASDFGYNGYQPRRIAAFYPPGILAQATTLPSEKVDDGSARVSGRVDPANAGPVLACRFEYVTEAEYNSTGSGGAQSTPCAPRPDYAGPTEVGATLTGLAQNTYYRYRLVVANGNGESLGPELEFRTAPAPPVVVTGKISNVQPEFATAWGLVAPGRGSPVLGCFFQFVTAASFASKGYAEAELSSCVAPKGGFSGTTEVSEGLNHLSPNTTYRYRLVAWNGKVFGYGQDATFTTTAKSKPEPDEEEIPEEPVPHPPPRHVRCTRDACAHKLRGSSEPKTWTSPGYPTSYSWEAAVRSHGGWMPHTKLVGGCVSTFRTKSLVVRLNGCGGHVKVRYVGTGTFTVVWQVFR